MARVLVRTVLSRYASTSPVDWVFGTGANGKPQLEPEQSDGLEFNVSHSHGWLACAVSRKVAVGVDVELCDEARDFMRLARRYFQAQELVALEGLPVEEQRQRFYRLWTLKEAWSKTRGDNIGSAMGAVGFSLEAPGTIAVSETGEPFPVDCWLLQPAPDFQLALCRARLSDLPPLLAVFETVPLGDYRPLELPLEATTATRGGLA